MTEARAGRGWRNRLDWMPFAFLVYLGIVFIQPAFDHAGWAEWTITLASVVVFLPLYFVGFRLSGARVLWPAAAIAALGFAVSPWNGGASVYLIYAASFVGFALPAPAAYRTVGGFLIAIGLYSWALHMPAPYWISALVFTALIGAVNVRTAEMARTNEALRLARDEVEKLAKLAERERISRDMHDVLGHTLTAIALKSELAEKLIDTDVVRAAQEIRDVARITRESLGELRAAIAGYRAAGIEAELGRARSALESAGLHVECEVESVSLTSEQEGVLALAVREGVTNVIRHAKGARTCTLRLRNTSAGCAFEIHDDGQAEPTPEGFGLVGMRERIEALGGSLLRDLSSGTRLVLTMPTR